MAKKTWKAYAQSRKNDPALHGVWECVTRPTPDTALNPERLNYLKDRALAVGLTAELRPIFPGRRAMALWVAYMPDAQGE